MESKRLEFVTFAVFFVILSILTFFVFQPFLRILVLAVVLAVLLNPINQKLVRFFGGHKSFVACLLVVVTSIFLIIPILFFGLEILGQAKNFFSLTQIGQGQYVQIIQQHINAFVQPLFPSFSFSIGDTVSNVVTFISSNLGVVLS